MKTLITNKEINKDNILLTIKEKGPISRSDLSKLLRVSKPTILTYINELITEDKIKEIGFKESSELGGRKARLLAYNNYFKFIISAILDIDRLTIGITDLDFCIINKSKKALDKNRSPERVVKLVKEEINNLVKAASIKMNNLIGLGISVPGLVDDNKGVVNFSHNLPGWKNILLKELLEKELDIKVFITHECRTRVLIEKFRLNEKSISTIAVVKSFEGIGSAVLINGKLVEGRDGIAGEIGHITYDNKSKVQCNCGNFGCVEALGSINALMENIKTKLKKPYNNSELTYKNNLSLEEVYKAFINGDRLVCEEVKLNARYLGFAVSNIIKFFNPQKIILYGAIKHFGEKYLDLVKENVLKETFPRFNENYNITFSNLKKDDELMGVAIMVFNNIFISRDTDYKSKFLVKKSFEKNFEY
jgi:predicted NBD/HSP70 family sugar kinase